MSRRELLIGLAATGLLPGARSAKGTEQPHRKFTMDLVCGNIGVHVRLPEAMALAYRHGFESVAPDAGFLKSLSTAQRDELCSDLKAKHLVWGAAGLPVDFRGSERAYQDGLKALGPDAKALNEVGATRMGTWISPTHAQLTYLANFRQHVARLSEIARMLGEQGIRLGLEYVGPKTSWTVSRYPFIHTMAEMRELIAAIGQPNVGLVLDSWHWYTAHETEADLVGLKGSDVICCDLNDAPVGTPIDSQMDLVRDLPCATGVIDLKTFLNALAKIGYDGPIRAEPFKAELRKLPAEDAVARTAQAMKQAFSVVV
jgi:sugar phosphate isomerase/epimerase